MHERRAQVVESFPRFGPLEFGVLFDELVKARCGPWAVVEVAIPAGVAFSSAGGAFRRR